MKPMKVDVGQHAPDLDEMIEKAGHMLEKLEMDNSQMRNITGVEGAPMSHYYTNQELPETPPEEITNKGATSENVSFIDANPHQTGSTLASHENPSGGDPHPPSSYTHSNVGKPPSDMRKQIEIILKKRCPNCGGDHMDKNVSCSVKKAGDPLAALLAGAKGGPQGPPMPPAEGGGDEPLGGDMPPGDDEPESPEELANKIHELVDKLKSGGDDEKPPMDDMGAGDGPPMPPGGGAGLPPGM